MIGVVEDTLKRKSRNGNVYIKFNLSDETSSIDAMLLNGRGQINGRWTEINRVDNFLSKHKMPKKESIVVFSARKGEDILFIDDISVVDEKIYMKLADVN